MGEVIGAGWLFNQRRRVGKVGTSVVVSIKRSLPRAGGLYQTISISGKKHSMVAYQ